MLEKGLNDDEHIGLVLLDWIVNFQVLVGVVGYGAHVLGNISLFDIVKDEISLAS